MFGFLSQKNIGISVAMSTLLSGAFIVPLAIDNTAAFASTTTPILYYNSSDNNSFDPSNSPTAVNDLSGNNYHASIETSDGANRVERADNGAFDFDETDSYIDLPDLPSSIDFSSGITVDFVADFDNSNNGSYERIIDFGNGSPDENIIVGREGTTNHLWFEFYGAQYPDNTTGNTGVRFEGAILDGFHRYTLIANGSEIKLYRDGQAVTTPGTIDKGRSDAVPSNTTREDNFIGKSNWTDDANFEGQIRHVQVFNQGLTEEQVADIEIDYRTVSFDSTDGSGTMADQTASSNANLNSNTFTPPTNYRFDGWSVNSDGSTLDYVDEASFDFSSGSDLTLYARWAVDGLIVTFDANGGDGDIPPQIAKTDTALTANSFTKGNDTFAGWNTQADGNGTSYADEASFPFTLSGSQVLYAQWTPAPDKTVQFNANGGTGTMADQIANNQTTLSPNQFERDNHAFEKWSAEQDGTGIIFNDGELFDFDQNMTLFAQWVETTAFSVTFNGNGANSGTMTAQTASEPTALKANSFNRWNRSFLGWSTTSNGSIEYEDREIYEFEEDVVLYARWGTGVTISFDSNASDATGSMSNQILSADQILNANQFERPGFVFSHWATTTSGGGTKYPDGWAGPVLPRDTTLYAQWVTDTGAMAIFNANRGKLGSLMPPQDLSSVGNIASNTFKEPNWRFKFKGWDTEPDGTGTFYSDKESIMLTDDTVLYAQWGYTISLRHGGGTPRTNQNVVVDSPSTIPESPFTRSGYVFAGWTSTGGTFSDRTVWYHPGDPLKINRQIVLHAKWIPEQDPDDKYVTFASNGGTPISGNNFLNSQAGSEPTRLNPTPYERDGFTFRGWSPIRNGPVEYTDQEVFEFDENQVLHAVWWQNRVTFLPNGGSGSAVSQSSRFDLPLRTNSYSYTGKVFAGWNTAVDGSGNAYADGQTFPFGSPEQTLTLYAQWEDKASSSTKTLFFNANGATAGYMAPQQASSSTAISPNSLTRTGYQFAGWDTNRNGGGTAYDDGDSFDFTVNDVLFAQWTPLVTYRANGGVGATAYQEITSSNHTLSPNTFTRSGYNFLGWATTANAKPIYADAQSIDLGNITNTGALTLYAKWAEAAGSEKTVVYQSNFNSQELLWQTSDTASQLSYVFSRKGYTLLGWSTSPSGSVEYEVREEYDFQANAVLYAVWKSNTIVFDANGGKGSMANLVSTRNIPLSANQFTRNGFVFSTWNTEPDGSGRTYSGGLTFPLGQQNQSTTLYAQWVVVPGSQVISFNANGGTGSMRTQVASSNSDLVLAPNGFQRDNHTFIEWNTQANGSGDEYQEGETIQVGTTNLTMYAQWESDGSITDQTVTFDENGGSGTMPDQTVNGRTVLDANQFNRSNHVFTGWNEERNGSGRGYADNSQIFTLTGVTLYAQWLELASNDIAISFDPNGGTGLSMPPLVDEAGESLTLPDSSFSRAGYVFLGWDTDDSATAATYQAGNSFNMPSTADTLFAIWEAEFFAVTFDKNDGDGTMSAQTSDEETNLFANKFTREKYEFKGWSTTANGSVEYADTAEYDFPTAKDDILYAIWEQVDFTVTFDKNNGSGSMPDQTASGEQPLAANTFTKADSRFLGWDTDKNATSPTYENADDFDFTTEQDTTLFAIWESLYKVTFNANGGTGSMAPQTGTSAAPLRLNEFEYDGFTFTGWATSSSGNVVYTDGGSYAFTSNSDLYAKWEATTYTVTFNSNGATGSMSAQTDSGTENLDEMSGLNRTGYTFLGWNTNPNARTALYSDEATFNFEKDVILYAIWSKTQNSVTWDSNGGSNVSGTNFVIGDSIAEPADPARSGKVFGGWSTSETSDQGDVANLISSWPYTPPSATNITIHAVWYDPCTTTDTSFSLNGNNYNGISVLSGVNCLITIPEDVVSIDVLVVGGGGGGGENAGIGGGGGGVTVKTSIDVSSRASIFATVGAGGIAGDFQYRIGTADVSTERNGGNGEDSEISIGNLNLFAGGGKGGKTHWDSNACTGDTRYAVNQATGGLADPNADSGIGGQGGLGGDGGAEGGSAGEAGEAGYSINLLGVSTVYGSGGGGGGWSASGGSAGAGAGAGGSNDDGHGGDGSPNQGGGGGAGSSSCNPGGAGGSGLVAIRYVVPTFTVSFQADSEGTGSLADLTKVYGQTLPLPTSTDANDAFSRNGYMVGGWSTSDGGSQAFELGENYTTDEDLTLYPVWVPLSVMASGDTYVQAGQSADSNFGSANALVLKNASNSINNNSNRVGYIKFTYNPNAVWTDAVFEMVVVDNFNGTNGTAYGNSYTTFNVDVYGATDSSWNELTLDFETARTSSAGWGINTAVWPWGANLATHLGTLSVPTDDSSEGQKYSLSSSALDEFLNDDADGNITLILVRRDTDAEGNISFASKENTLYEGPTLALAGSGYEYTVAYDINGGSGTVPDSGSFTDGGSSYAIESTTGITPPTNKTITGWNTEADGSGTDYAAGDSYSTSRSLTLYAKYIDNPVVTFDANYVGGPGQNTQSVQSGIATDLRANSFSRPGFEFDGWNTETDGTGDGYLDQEEITTTEDITLYALWVGASYTVIYEYNGADAGNSLSSESYTTGEADLSLPTPTRNGYTFDGWYENTDLSGTAVASTYTTQRDRTLYAKWTIEDYSVTYNTTDADSGTAPTDSNIYNIGDQVAISSNSGNLVRAGYVFAGWALNSSGNGTVYQSGDNLTVSNANIDFYPKWTAGTYTITYDANGGTGSPADATDSFTTGDTPFTDSTLSAVGTLEKTGYDFLGWNESATDTTERSSYTTTRDVTLYAVWEIKTITYSFNVGSITGADLSGVALSDGATLPSNGSDEYAEVLTLPALSQTDLDTEGDSAFDYVFAGWLDGSNIYEAGDNYRLGDVDVTFTAQWTKVYQVKYALAGGTITESGDFEHDTECGTTPDWICSAGEKINANSAPIRAGYNFDGWKPQSGNIIQEEDEFTVDANTYVLSAQWTAIDYTLSFDSNGGDNSPSDEVLNIGQTHSLPSAGDKTGYTFDGWSDGSKTYPAGSTYLVGDSDVNFVAQWTANVYTVNYDWNGGQLKDGQLAVSSDTYTVGNPSMTLPDGNNYERDGYTFIGWSTSSGGSAITGFQPIADDVLYALWADGSFSITLDPKGGTLSQTNLNVGRGSSFVLPSVSRDNFVFTGWFDQASAGTKLGDSGDSITPSVSQTIYARWVQESLFGIDMAELESVENLSVGSTTGGSVFKIHGNSPTSAFVKVPSGALPDNTVVSVRFFKDTQNQENLIEGDNDYLVSLLVSWLTGTGDSATVPDTDPNKPIEVTFTSSAIKAGQRIYQLIGEDVRDLGIAQADGSITVYITEDPALVVVSTAPDAPTSVTATSGDSQATVSWNAPVANGGSEITGYTVTSSRGQTCTTATTSCTITGLTNGTSYTFTVSATNQIGDSAPSLPSASIIPASSIFTVSFDSNGGSSVANGTFFRDGSISQPNSPTLIGFLFNGWSTVKDDPSTKLSFPYTPPRDGDLTLFALWVVSNVSYVVTFNSNGGSAVGDGSFIDGGSISTPPADPSRSGFRFTGWSTAKNNPSTRISFPYTPTVRSNITLFALWSIVPTGVPTPSTPAVPVVPENTPDRTPEDSKIGFVPSAPSASGPSASQAGVIFRTDTPKDSLIADGGSWNIQLSPKETVSDSVTEQLTLRSKVTGNVDLSATGLKANSYLEIWAFSDPVFIAEVETDAFGRITSELELPESLLPGEHTLQIGTLNSTGSLITVNIPITVEGKVTVGTFKGFIAIYTKDLEGQRLSAKVAGKWLVHDPIARFKDFSYGRVVRFTGAGYEILIDVYINRQFFERTTTRTR